MSKPIRFLGFAILAWAGVRAVSLGIIPGTEMLAFDAHASQPRGPRLPPIQPTALPLIEPVAMPVPQPQPPMGYGVPPAYPAYGAYPPYAPYPVYVPVPAAANPSGAPQIIYVSPPPRDPREVHVYGAGPPNAEEPEKLAMATPVPPVLQHQSTPSFEEQRRPKLPDRLSLSTWGTMRSKAGSDSLANAGMLGASQAGARVLWRYSPELALSVRGSAPVNSSRGAEGAVGIRYQPFASWPIAVNLERRHRFRDYGRNAFALFAEGGVYGRPLPWQSTLDGYFQGGVVDFNNPYWFVDGQLAMTRPIWRNLSGGVGIWGGAQPGLNRFDAGPRLSLRLTPKIRAHFDYRYNVAGNAEPGSGAVMTLAGDF